MGDVQEGFAKAAEPQQALQEKLIKYLCEYPCFLIGATAIDGEDADEDEITNVTAALLKFNIKRRDEQIGHLERLRDLFDEALQCAEASSAVFAARKIPERERVISVRKIIDNEYEFLD
jgi:hypothetical protein